MYGRFKGDFTGFSIDGIHSDDLGITRVSDGSRYNETLLPSFSDRTIQVRGNDESYYFGTDYTDKQFSLEIAFDDLTELQLRKLKTILHSKKLQKLVFDENPYKYYMVKSNGNPQLNYICFEEHNHRIYKGEGTIDFIAYYPFARSVHNYIKDFKGIYSKDWETECGMRLSKQIFDIPYGETSKRWFDYYDTYITRTIKVLNEYNQYTSKTVKCIPVYNAGDLETPFILTIIPPETKSANCVISLYTKNSEKQDDNKYTFNNYIQFSNMPARDEATQVGISMNTKTNIVQKYYLNADILKDVYNKYISDGTFFHLPIGESLLCFEWVDNVDPQKINIEYNHIYY